MLSHKFKAALMATALLITLSSVFIILGTDLLDLDDFNSNPLWKSGSSSEYYVLDADGVKDNPEFQSLVENLSQPPVPKSNLKDYIRDRLKGPDTGFLQKIESQVREQYTEEFKATLKKELEAKLREGEKSRFSLELEEEVRAAFLKENAESIKNGVVKDLLKDTTDEKLRAKVEQMRTFTFDRNAYFQSTFEKILADFSPTVPALTRKGTSVHSNGLKEVTVPPKSRKELTKGRVKVKPEVFQDLQQKHDAYVAYLRSLSVPPADVFGGRGIVISAGKLHMLGALNVIVQVRETGSQLPVELVLDARADYNKHLCEEVLPQLNAKCLVIEQILGPEMYAKFTPDGFPMKAIALLVSSFDDTVFLDSDTFPVQNVDLLLSSAPYLQKKFILWPDNWHKGTSPVFYDIARLSAGEPIRRDGLSNQDSFESYLSRDRETDVLFHDLDGIPPFTSVESGQLVFSKREHFRSLFLALYYNLHGEKYYYPLLFQGVFGSGDRETFVPALHVMNEPYYLTDWEMKFSGVDRERVTEPGVFYYDESTMIQSDPGAAMKFREKWRKWLASQKLDSRLDPFQNGDYTSDLVKKFFAENTDTSVPQPFFLHVHSPKINSVYNAFSTKKKYDFSSRYMKKIGENDDTDRLQRKDWELRFQAINAWSTCEGLNDAEFWVSVELDGEAMCKQHREYVSVLKKDSNDVGAAKLGVMKVGKERG